MHGVGNDLVPAASIIERAENDSVGERHRGLEDDLARARSDQGGDQVAQVSGHFSLWAAGSYLTNVDGPYRQTYKGTVGLRLKW